MRQSSIAVMGMISLLLLGYPATAADFKSSALKDGRIVISISGDVAEGDSDAFKAGQTPRCFAIKANFTSIPSRSRPRPF
jgi:hypothetical protein